MPRRNYTSDPVRIQCRRSDAGTYTLWNLYAMSKLLILEVAGGASMRHREAPNQMRNGPHFVNEHNRHLPWRASPKTGPAERRLRFWAVTAPMKTSRRFAIKAAKSSPAKK